MASFIDFLNKEKRKEDSTDLKENEQLMDIEESKEELELFNKMLAELSDDEKENVLNRFKDAGLVDSENEQQVREAFVFDDEDFFFDNIDVGFLDTKPFND